MNTELYINKANLKHYCVVAGNMANDLLPLVGLYRPAQQCLQVSTTATNLSNHGIRAYQHLTNHEFSKTFAEGAHITYAVASLSCSLLL